MLSGSYMPGELYLFPGNKDGGVDKFEILKDASNKALVVGNASVPFAFDWDQDGDLDLIVGDIQGNVHYIPNLGSAEKPSFSKFHGPMMADGKPVKVEGDSGPVVADW